MAVSINKHVSFLIITYYDVRFIASDVSVGLHLFIP
jgi:hypothetical protein